MILVPGLPPVKIPTRNLDQKPVSNLIDITHRLPDHPSRPVLTLATQASRQLHELSTLAELHEAMHRPAPRRGETDAQQGLYIVGASA